MRPFMVSLLLHLLVHLKGEAWPPHSSRRVHCLRCRWPTGGHRSWSRTRGAPTCCSCGYYHLVADYQLTKAPQDLERRGVNVFTHWRAGVYMQDFSVFNVFMFSSSELSSSILSDAPIIIKENVDMNKSIASSLVKRLNSSVNLFNEANQIVKAWNYTL